MKLEVEQIDLEKEEEVIVHCHDVEAVIVSRKYVADLKRLLGI